jgi:hypothetical protein
MTILHHQTVPDRVQQNRTTYIPELSLLTTMIKGCKIKRQHSKAIANAIKGNATANAIIKSGTATANAIDSYAAANADNGTPLPWVKAT